MTAAFDFRMLKIKDRSTDFCDGTIRVKCEKVCLKSRKKESMLLAYLY